MERKDKTLGKMTLQDVLICVGFGAVFIVVFSLPPEIAWTVISFGLLLGFCYGLASPRIQDPKPVSEKEILIRTLCYFVGFFVLLVLLYGIITGAEALWKALTHAVGGVW